MCRWRVPAITLVLLIAPVSRGQSSPPKDAFDDLSARAGAAMEAERVDEAIDLYGRATRVRPGWSEGWWHLGTLLYDQERFAESRDAFTHFVGNTPKAGPGFAMIGLCEFQSKGYREALSAMERGLQLGLGPNRDFSRSVLYRDATLHALLGRPEVALQRLTLLLNQDAAAHPGADAKSLLEDMELMDALGIAALRMARLPVDIPPKKTALVRRAGRAQALSALADWVSAGVEFNRLAADFGQEPGVHYMHGVFLLKEHPEDAVSEFQREIEIAPKDVDARVQIAFADLTRGDYARGRRYASEAVKLAPGNFAAHLVSGQLWLALGKMEQAQ